MTGLPKTTKENISSVGDEKQTDKIENTEQAQTNPIKKNTLPDADQSFVKNMPKKPSKKDILDDKLIESKGDKYYAQLLKTTNIKEVADVLNAKKIDIIDKDKIEKMDKAMIHLKNLENSVIKIEEVFSKDADEKTKLEYVHGLLEKGRDPFESLKDIKDRRIVNRVTRILLQNESVNDFFVTYFGEEASFDREEWLLKISQNTGSKELTNILNDFFEQVRKYKEKEKEQEVPYFDFVTWAELLKQYHENHQEDHDNNSLESILEDMDVGQLKYEIEKYIINNEDNADKYEEITAFYNGYLDAGFNSEALKNIDIDNLTSELESFTEDYLSNDKNDQDDISTILDLIQNLRAEWQPEESGGNNDEVKKEDKEDDGEVKKPSKGPAGFWSTIGSLLGWKIGEFAIPFLIGSLFAPITTALVLSKQRLQMVKSGKNFEVKIDLDGLDELYKQLLLIKDSSSDKKK